jgi:MFS family permease
MLDCRPILATDYLFALKRCREHCFWAMSLARLPRNIWVLTICQFLAMSSAPLMVFVGELLGRQLAPSPKWATLPLTALILGTALSTIPAAMLMRRVGRKRGSYVGYCFALAGSLLAMQAALSASFGLFLLGAFLLGVNLAFAQQFRFAALESLADPADFPTAFSVMMLGGIVSAYIGPEIGLIGKDLIASPHGYAGSFLLLSGLILLSMIVFLGFREPVAKSPKGSSPARALSEITRNPLFLIAILASGVSFGVMSLIMTATPLNMNELRFRPFGNETVHPRAYRGDVLAQPVWRMAGSAHRSWRSFAGWSGFLWNYDSDWIGGANAVALLGDIGSPGTWVESAFHGRHGVAAPSLSFLRTLQGAGV